MLIAVVVILVIISISTNKNLPPARVIFLRGMGMAIAIIMLLYIAVGWAYGWIVVVVCGLAYFFIGDRIPKMFSGPIEEKPEPTKEVVLSEKELAEHKKKQRDAMVVAFHNAMPKHFRFELSLMLNTYLNKYNPQNDGLYTAALQILIKRTLPDVQLLKIDPAGREWGKYIQDAFNAADEDDERTPYAITNALSELGEMRYELEKLKFVPVLPYALRTEHHQILASPGHGKSQCITNMILDDLETDAAIVVIDSQGDLINSLATRVPADRLILIDPETCPPALNIFANGAEGEQETATAIELYEYIFSALDAKMTGKQALVYRYLSRLCMTVPGATINTMRDMLQPGGLVDYQEYIDRLGDNARAFFSEFQLSRNNQYGDTRQEVLRRLLMVLEGETFSRMLAASEMKINLAREIDAGKVILISTNKKLLKGGSSLLGRIFLAQVMQAVMSRPPGARRRTYLYIDEFADYAEDSHILLDLFSQGRKYELGMVVCHQNLDQLTPKLAAAISSSTAIKFAGGVSSTDAGTLANQMRTDKLMIDRQRKGTFLAYFKDIGVMPWPVDFGRIDRTPEVTELRTVQARMRELYGDEPISKSRPVPQPPEKNDDDDYEEAF